MRRSTILASTTAARLTQATAIRRRCQSSTGLYSTSGGKILRVAFAERTPADLTDPANPLEEFFWSDRHRLIYKWIHYLDIYHRHFMAFRNREIGVLEFGVAHGGSLQMWKSYFGAKARIYGVDHNPACKACEEAQIEVFIGSQGDREFL